MAKIKVQQEYEVETPLVPNFLMLSGTGSKIAVADLTEDELRAVGRAWADALCLKRATDRSRTDYEPRGPIPRI